MLGVRIPSLTLVISFASVAQLDRAPGFEPVGCAFESRRTQGQSNSGEDVPR